MARTKFTAQRKPVPGLALGMATTVETLKQVETRLGYKKVFLPAPLDGTETEDERALLFYRTSAKIEHEGTGVPYAQRIACLAEILNLTSISSLTMAEIFRIYDEQVFDPSHWTVRGYYDNTGALIDDALGTDGNLKPLGNLLTNQVISTLRPPSVCYALVDAKIDFKDDLEDCSIIMRVSTHIELPQGTHKFKDGGGNEKTTTTFIGDNDITSIPKADFDIIRAMTNQMVIGDLETPGYGQIDTTINYDTKDTLLRNNILGKFNTYLKDELFEALCPGITQNPSDALTRVAQVVTDSMGNKVTLTIHAYFTNILNALQCVTGELDQDICLFAVEHMETSIRAQLQTTYKDARANRPRNQYAQMRALKALKILATDAETHVNNHMRMMVEHASASGLLAIPGLAANPGTHGSTSGSTISTGSAIPNLAGATTDVLASQAENTIALNTFPGPFNWEWGMCLACGSTNHPFTSRTGKRTCPFAHLPEAIARAEQNVKILRTQRKAKSRSKKSLPIPSWDRCSKRQKVAIVASVISKKSHVMEFKDVSKDLRDMEEEKYSAYSRGSNDDSEVFHYTCIMVFQQGIKPPLPVPLDGDLPHIALTLGPHAGPTNPTLTACVDSGAGANVGLLTYFDGILFMHPECVDQIFCASEGNYSSIRMTGIVSEDTSGVTSTELPVAVRLKTPFRDRNGNRLGVTVALGNAVSINFILSNAWMKKLGASIDYGTNRLMANLQDHPGFPLSYHRPKRASISPLVRTRRKYFRDMLPVLSGLANVMAVHNPTSPWLHHAKAVIQHYDTVPASLPLGPAHKPNDLTLQGRFAPANHPAPSVHRPGCEFYNSATPVAADGAATAVSFMSDSPSQAVGGPGSTHGQLIVPGAAVHTNGDAASSDDGTLFDSTSDSGEE